jgi:class 3 adenylate cyclase
MGLSGPADDVSADARVLDIEAVVHQLGLSQFTLVGLGLSSVTTIKYAAAHSHQVTQLVLTNPFADGEKLYASPAFTAWNDRELLIDEQWDFFINANSARTYGYKDPELAQSFATLLKATFTAAVFLAYRRENRLSNATAWLPAVQAPTLVFGSENDYVPLTLSRDVAAHIPHARFMMTIGSGAMPLDDAMTDAILDFLRPEGVVRPAPAGEPPPVAQASGTAVILFTDIVSSTELTERMGDVAFRDASRSLDASLRSAIRDAGGAAIDGKLLGDGVLATFPSAAQAIGGARRCLALSAASELGLHIGLHAGDVIREDNNVYGGAVNIASRICGLSAPGEILVSDVVRGMARSSAGVEFEDRGEQEMKGVGEAVRVYAVRAEE